MGAATIAVSEQSFDTEIASGLVLMDFWATWCGPCRAIGPILDELATEMKDTVKIGKVNVDDAQDLASRLGVQFLPTLILFKNGQEVERIVGGKTKAQFKTWIEGHAK